MHESFQRAVKENGSLSYCTVQCMPFGPPRVGKTCLYKRLLDETPLGKRSTKSEASSDSKSTDALEERKMIQVRMNHAPPKMIISETGKWKLVDSLDDEVAIILKSVHEQRELTGRKATFETKSSPLSTQHDLLPEQSEEIEASSSVVEKSGTELDNAAISLIAQGLKLTNRDMSDVQSLLDNSVTIYYTDTGGQPEFQEVVPALVAGPAIFFLIFSLCKDFDSLYEVRYEPSSLDDFEPYENSYTVGEVFKQCFASILSYHDGQSRECATKMQPPPVKIFTIATHKDLVDPQKIEATDAALKKMVSDSVLESKDLIEPFSKGSMLIPVDNYSSEDGNVVRDVIERVLKREQSAYRIKIPVPWLGVEIALRQKDSSIISYSECLNVAKTFNISQHDLPDCLWFLHYKTGSIRYYGERVHSLKDTIIIKPAIIFTAITKLITSTFILKHVNHQTEENFRNLGLFKADEIRGIFENHQLKLEQLLDLLQHLNILSKAYDEEFTYFLPCALVHADHCNHNMTADTVLLILFKGRVVPKGFFSGLLAVLVENKSSIKRDHNRRPLLFRNQATFFLNTLKCSVTLIAKLSFISVEIKFKNPNQSSQLVCSQIRNILKTSLANVCEALQYQESCHFGLYCTEVDCKNEIEHPAEIIGLDAKCCVTFEKYALRDPKDTCWIDSSGMVTNNTKIYKCYTCTYMYMYNVYNYSIYKLIIFLEKRKKSIFLFNFLLDSVAH